MLIDILEHMKLQMKEDKENIKSELAQCNNSMKAYYQGRYDAYYAIIDSFEREVKKLRLTY